MIDRIALTPDWQSAQLADTPKLISGELHLWCLPLSINDIQAQQTLNWLSDHQHDKYSRRQTEQLRHSYLAGRYYLLSLLAAYSACEPEEILLNYTRLNKPYLGAADRNIHFNFTDTVVDDSGYALLAFCRELEVGVDIEALSRRSDFGPIVEKRFSDSEKALVTMENGEINPELFLSVWTRKEASGKATGQGINFKMNQRNLIQYDSAHLNYVDESQRAWRLSQLRLSENLIGCVVHEGHQPLEVKAFNRLDTSNTNMP